MIGTLVNFGAVILGSTIGLIVHRNLPKRYVQLVFQIMGLFTLVLGFKMALEGKQLLVIIFSLIAGGLLGERLKMDEWINSLGDKVKQMTKSKNDSFSEGLITAFLLFCVGSMTILGAIQEGLGGEPELLLIKSLMDGISSVALTVAFGIGVLFSAIPLLIFQGGITLLAAYAGDFINPTYITEVTATGGVILIGLGINLLEIKKIKVVNLLPAMLIVPLLMELFVRS
ncbi:MAG TPA: DUF554 domain-containing protein [Bacteroidales bacterium]|nr:DUF554 domain-containing protein [Bacteroidales bacterium]